MAMPHVSAKRLAISQANARMVVIVSAAAFVSIFCLFAAKSIFSQVQYQSRIISAKDKADKQLKANIAAFSNLVDAYDKFDSAQTNIIGGSLNGTGPSDGENAKIILDALPYKYDFPALVSSVEKLLSQHGYSISTISGTDQEVQYQSSQTSTNPQPVSMPFSFTVNNANYAGAEQLIGLLQASIRPLAIDNLTINGGGNNMAITINAHSYYEAGKSVSITEKTIR